VSAWDELDQRVIDTYGS